VTTRGHVLITGTSTGIGRASALHLASRGWQVLAGVRKLADGEDLRAEGGLAIRPIRLDVTDPSTIAAARDEVLATLGESGLRGLVNNAGISSLGPLEAMSVDLVRQQFEVNVFGTLEVTRAFLPLLRQGRGHLVNIGSAAGHTGIPFSGAYCASKAALAALSEALAGELSPQGVRVTLIEPGSFRTPIWEKSTGPGDRGTSDLESRYARSLERAREMASQAARLGGDPRRVAHAVARTLEGRASGRLLVGLDARLLAHVVRWPTPLVRQLMRWAYGLTGDDQ